MAQVNFVGNYRDIQSMEMRKDEEPKDSKQTTHTLEQAIEETSECTSM